MTFQKLKPRVINYRDYKFFDNVRYRNELLQEISYFEFNDNGFSTHFERRSMREAIICHLLTKLYQKKL